jgi:hypothetical protein
MQSSLIYFKNILINENIIDLFYFGIINNLKLIIIKNYNKNSYKYICFKCDVKFYKYKNRIVFVSDLLNKKILDSFYLQFSHYLSIFQKNYSNRILLKGLGFKINLTYTHDKIILKFKLGFSHLIEYSVDTNKCFIFLKKNKINIKSEDTVFLGNIANQIKNLKPINVYTRRGFKIKNKKIIYKAIKKK